MPSSPFGWLRLRRVSREAVHLSHVLIKNLGKPETIIKDKAEEFYARQDTKFGLYLIREGVITEEELELALAIQKLLKDRIDKAARKQLVEIYQRQQQRNLDAVDAMCAMVAKEGSKT